MKRIKTQDIFSNRLIKKAEFARRQGVSQTEINRRIKRGDLIAVITLDGSELVYL